MAKTQTKKNVKNSKNVKNVKDNKNESVKKIQKEEKIEKVEKVEVVESTKNEKAKKIAKRIFDVIFWVAIILLAIIWITDFSRLQGEKEPMFCLSEKTHEFDDGTVYECKGLGYNIYQYDRESIDVRNQFSPFFIGMKK